MKKLLPYRIIGFILLPIAAYLGINVVFGLLNALANPIMLLPLFFIAAIVIYVMSSFFFLTKAIDKKQTCKHFLYDLIKVNAIMSLVVCVLGILMGTVVLVMPQLISRSIEQAAEQQPIILENTTISVLEKTFKIVMKIWLVLSILLVVHISYTFKLIKEYKHMFEPK